MDVAMRRSPHTLEWKKNLFLCCCAGTAASDATLVARLGNSGTAAERASTGLHASGSGRVGADGPCASGDLNKPGSLIQLPALPWSDWEVPADQVSICKHEDGSDWELGAGAYGKVGAAAFEGEWLCDRELLGMPSGVPICCTSGAGIPPVARGRRAAGRRDVCPEWTATMVMLRTLCF
jgi:hypothetical protein